MTEVTQSVTQQRLDDWWRLNRGMIPLHPGKKPKERPGCSPSTLAAFRDWNNRVELFHEYQAELKETTISPNRHALYLLTLMECGFKPQGYGDHGSVSREQYENMLVLMKKLETLCGSWMSLH